MRELSLFTGAGGGVLGSKLLGWETIGYVEYETYCQKILKQRIADGILDAAPIFGDIRNFISEGYADAYKGMVDVVAAGFPCQPFSVAGKGAGEDDPRNMWPQTIEVIRRVRPRFAFLENVPGLLAHKYIRRIFGDLAESGYDCRWRIVSAAEVGAPHRRDRLWVVANDRSQRGEGLQSKAIYREQRVPWGKDVRGIEDLRNRPDIPDPLVRRMGDGVAFGLDRLKAIGNGQVSIVAATAWRLLNDTRSD